MPTKNRNIEKIVPFAHDSSVAIAPSSSYSLGAYNKRVSSSLTFGSLDLNSPFGRTSDTRQPLYAIGFEVKIWN